MLLSDFFQSLSFNEFANLSLSSEGSGQISVDKVPRIISNINDALLDLCARFILFEKELVVQSIIAQTLYPLRVEYAVTNATSTEEKYIIDTPEEPFTDDIITITYVKNEVGHKLPLNDDHDFFSVFTPQFDTVQLTHTGFSQAYFIGYQAQHPVLDVNGDLTQKIEIPNVMATVLRYKVAAIVFSGMAGQEYTNKVQELDSKYEAGCALLKERGLVDGLETDSNNKLHLRGFV